MLANARSQPPDFGDQVFAAQRFQVFIHGFTPIG
jgi:hypothetical protein